MKEVNKNKETEKIIYVSKIKKDRKKKIVRYTVLFVLAVFLGAFFEHYANDKIQVETVAVDDTEGDALYAERSDAAETVDDKININTASAELLDTLEGIGESTAKKIVDYREKNGPFKTIENIMDVSGIGEKKFEVIKDKICAQ